MHVEDIWSGPGSRCYVSVEVVERTLRVLVCALCLVITYLDLTFPGGALGFTLRLLARISLSRELVRPYRDHQLVAKPYRSQTALMHVSLVWQHCSRVLSFSGKTVRPSEARQYKCRQLAPANSGHQDMSKVSCTCSNPPPACAETTPLG